MAARRTLIPLALGVAALAGSAAAAEKLVDAAKLFPFLTDYWKLPAAERDRFAPAYAFRWNGQPLTAPLSIVEGGAVQTIPMRPDGRAAKLPSLADLQTGKARLTEGGKYAVALDLEVSVPPAVQFDPRELAAALAQASAAEHKLAGVIAFLAPKLSEVVFQGAGSGEARFADGRKAPLPGKPGNPAFNPAKFPGAVAVVLAKPPARVTID
jgi:hypothetical protein